MDKDSAFGRAEYQGRWSLSLQRLYGVEALNIILGLCQQG